MVFLAGFIDGGRAFVELSAIDYGLSYDGQVTWAGSKNSIMNVWCYRLGCINYWNGSRMHVARKQYLIR